MCGLVALLRIQRVPVQFWFMPINAKSIRAVPTRNERVVIDGTITHFFLHLHFFFSLLPHKKPKQNPKHQTTTSKLTRKKTILIIMQSNQKATVAPVPSYGEGPVYDQQGYPVDDGVVNGNSPTNSSNYNTPTPPPTPMVMGPQYIPVGSRKPVMVTYCPNCVEKNVQTRTRTKANGTTWLCVGAGFLIFWPLCWVPLCVDDMKQTNHYCTSCGTKIGRVKPFQ